MTTEISKPPAATPAPQFEPRLGDPSPCVPRRPAPRASPHDGRSPRTADRTGSEFEATARAFADSTLRALLEVMNQRRAFAQVRPHLDAAVRDSILALLTARGGGAPVATLRRVRVQVVAATAVEAFGTFSRGHRIHAIAARLTKSADGRWQVSALALG